MTSEDDTFVESVYFETQRWIIEALFRWRGDEVERAKFSQSYDPNNTQVIEVDGEDAGWLTVQRVREHIQLDSIYLTRKWQGIGIGTALIRGLIAEANEAQVPLRLSTAKINPSRLLYERLGFVVTGKDDYKVYMERRFEAQNQV